MRHYVARAGPIANSGLSIRPKFSRFDARARFDVPVEATIERVGAAAATYCAGPLRRAAARSLAAPARPSTPSASAW